MLTLAALCARLNNKHSSNENIKRSLNEFLSKRKILKITIIVGNSAKR